MTGGLQPAWPHLPPLPVPESAAGGVLRLPGVLDPVYRILLSLKMKLKFPSTKSTLPAPSLQLHAMRMKFLYVHLDPEQLAQQEFCKGWSSRAEAA
jgi:hypothetical protein